MRTIEVMGFNELKDEQKENLIDKSVEDTLGYICEGHYDILGEEYTQTIKECVDESEILQTPWFLGCIVYEKLQDVLREDAIANLEGLEFTTENIQII